jgi:CRP/FNR family cyclic AMP-dependent transcriptional regulator
VEKGLPQKILEQLQKFPHANIKCLKTLFQEELEDFLEDCRIVTIKKDTRFITSGEPLSKIMILIAGSVNVLEEYRTGIAYIFQENEAPSIFGEMELIAEMEFFMASLVAKTECLVITIPIHKYLAYIKRHPNLLYERAKENLKVLLESGHNNRVYLQLQSIDRIKIYFIKHYEVNGQDGICTLRVTHQRIADETGYSVKTVLRCVTKLKEREFISVLGQKIIISRTQYIKMLDSMEYQI